MRLLTVRVALYLLSALLGCCLYFRLAPYVWPIVPIPRQFSAGEMEHIARAALLRAGVAIPGSYRYAVTFAVDDCNKTYLEHLLGGRQAQRGMLTAVPVCTWHVRWFQPQHKEQFLADIALDGQLLYYEHQLPDNAGIVHPSNSSLRAKQFIAHIGYNAIIAGLVFLAGHSWLIRLRLCVRAKMSVTLRWVIVDNLDLRANGINSGNALCSADDGMLPLPSADHDLAVDCI